MLNLAKFTYPSFLLHVNPIKQIACSFHLSIAVRHLESNESASGAGFMASRIQIWFR